MEFLQSCAQRLDAGEDASTVMADLRTRYTTIRCVNVKSSLVRSMCHPTPEFVLRADGDPGLLSGRVRPPPDFPPRLSENVRAFKPSKLEVRECKRLSAASALHKNKKSRRVDGRRLLRACREEVDSVVCGARDVGPNLVLAIMMLTGRRTCEVINGKSEFEAVDDYSLRFGGQAKRRSGDAEYTVPCLHRASTVVDAIRRMRTCIVPPASLAGVSDNQRVSQKYQSWLRRSLLGHPDLCQAGKVHALRGLYARMVYRLFDWETDGYSEAFVVMRVLGHAGLTESLVYTPFHLGEDFANEPSLGSSFAFHRCIRESFEEDAEVIESPS